MKKKIFIDGKSGTTGLRIEERLSGRDDVEIIALPDALRRDPAERKKMLNSADFVFLCLPDAAAIEAVGMIDNPDVVVIDASTAHRTNPEWAYAFPELSPEFENKLKSSKRIAVPGCHASGFIALTYPLIKAGILPKDALLSAHSITGYSGGGKAMIADYESDERDELLDAPRQYGIGQSHKHIPEMVKIVGLDNAPLFCPIVADFYSGMEVTIPLHRSQLRLPDGASAVERIKGIYKELYNTPIVSFLDGGDESGFLSAAAMSGKDTMKISVWGNEERMILVARYDNLGKGASGAAVEALNVLLGTDKCKTLEI